MSLTLNINPKIARAVSELGSEQGALLEVETVYSKMIELYGDEIFQSERYLAQIAVKQKIKSFLRNSFKDDDQDDLFDRPKAGTPATLSVRQADGHYAYVPMKFAVSSDLEAAFEERQRNIDNAIAALAKLKEQTSPVKAIMDANGVPYGEAERILFEQAEKTPSSEVKTA